MKLLLAQINPRVGDVPANLDLCLMAIKKAVSEKVDAIVFPELALTGYPPRDLLDYPELVTANLSALEELAKHSTQLGIFCGFVDRNPNPYGKPYLNGLAFCYQGKRVHTYYKRLLPYYDIFDEERYFESVDSENTFEWKGKKVGLAICEDIWNQPGFLERGYQSNPLEDLKKKTPDFVVAVAASPFHLGKTEVREKVTAAAAKFVGCPVLHCNQVGANDELIFDGVSLAAKGNGEIIARGLAFKEDSVLVDLGNPLVQVAPFRQEEVTLKKALALGIRDYVLKCGSSGVILGLSGGIDSSVVAALAVEALGPTNVLGVSLPSRFTSSASKEDAKTLAKNLGISFLEVPVGDAMEAFEKLILPLGASGVTLENIQPRIRMTVLMALANQGGKLLLNTSNKSEIAAGYATLYGDTAGALSVLGDLTKKQVYALAKDFNLPQEIIPLRVIERAPSAELKPNQKDEDTLPPYSDLDRLVKACIESSQGMDKLSEMGIAGSSVATFKKMHRISEYKRRQQPPVLRISPRAFGMGRRMPIASRCYLDF